MDVSQLSAKVIAEERVIPCQQRQMGREMLILNLMVQSEINPADDSRTAIGNTLPYP